MDKTALARLLDADGWPAEHPASRRERRARPDRAWRAPKARRPALTHLADLAHQAALSNRANGLVLSATLDATNEERAWIASHLRPFAGGFSEYQLLAAALRRVKGGKEANVYCCAAHPSSGLDLIAAKPYWPRLLRHVELMLSAQVVHADLSAYDVLCWEGEPRIFDFPQVVDPRQQREAFAILQRDNERLCQHFAPHGVASQPSRLARAVAQARPPRQRGRLSRCAMPKLPLSELLPTSRTMTAPDPRILRPPGASEGLP